MKPETLIVAPPLPPEALLGLDNAVLSTHQGSAMHKVRFQMGEVPVANMAAHLAKEPPHRTLN